MAQQIQERHKEKEEFRVIRILSKDIEGKLSIYAGLTKIKGVSWSFSNAVCRKLGISRDRKIGSLTEEEIKKISDFIKNPDVPVFIMNRKYDYDSGINRHLIGTDLELRKDFDIKKLKKIKTYRGVRHAAGQPVRGQRTKSHFRAQKKSRKVIGVRKNPHAKQK